MRDNSTNPGQAPLMAAIDLGSNSFHMIVARMVHGEIRPLQRIGEKVQLAAGLGVDGAITPEAMERGLKCLARFSQNLANKRLGLLRIVGTNTFRKATNSAEFIERAEAVLGQPIDVISGHEEARLIYLGVAHTRADDGERRLVIDIGGGSTELIIGERFESNILESLAMGCVTWTDRYFPAGELSLERFQSAYYAAQVKLLTISEQYKSLGWNDVVGSSGSVRSASNILFTLGEGEVITRQQLEMLKNRVLEFSQLDRVKLPGMKTDRKTIFPAGLAILMACFDTLGVEQMSYSNGALREGVLYDLSGRGSHENVRERTLSAMMHRYEVDSTRASSLGQKVMDCFDQVASGWALTSEDRQLLWWGAILSEIGLYISHTQYPQHSAYLIQNSEMPGFSKSQQNALASLVEGRRKLLPRTQQKAPLPRNLFHLVVLLRIGLILGHASEKKPAPVTLTAGSQSLSLSFESGWLDHHPLTRSELDQEQYSLQRVGFTLHLG